MSIQVSLMTFVTNSSNTPVFNFDFQCIYGSRHSLPGRRIDPRIDSLAAIAAYNNVNIVVNFLNDVLELQVLDKSCPLFISSINCTVGGSSNTWGNAAWYPRCGKKQVVYGQIENHQGELISFASSLTIVAHELFHGVTYFKTQLPARYGEPGALNESYSDIFAVIVANRNQPYISQWNWEIGEPLTNCGFPVRNIQCPEKYSQPAHFLGYKIENEYLDENGGMKKESNVHYNNGIHNKAAYNLITATRNNSNEYLFNQSGDLRKISRLFYDGLLSLKGLGEGATFKDSGLKLIGAIAGNFQDDNRQYEIGQAIRHAFDLVGVSLHL